MELSRWIALFVGCAMLAASQLVGSQRVIADDGTPPRKLALLVGVKEYNHAELPNLRFPENDVEDLAEVLRKQKFQVILLTTSAGKKDPSQLPTCENIQRSLKELLASVTKRDLIVVGLAGHGIQPLGSDNSYFCPLDGNPTTKGGKEKNDPNVAAAPETLISIDDLLESLQNSGVGQKLLLVDACRNDPKVRGRRGVEQVRVQSLPTETGVLLSCSAGQFAFEHQSWGKRGNGAFFSQVIGGIDGGAADETGLVTYEGLAIYVRKRVPAIVQKVYGKDGGEQRPNEIKNFSGDLISLAMVNPNRTVKPDNLLKVTPSITAPERPPNPTLTKIPTSGTTGFRSVGQLGEQFSGNLLKMEFVWCPPGKLQVSDSDSAGVAASANTLALYKQATELFNKLTVSRSMYQAKRISAQQLKQSQLTYDAALARYNAAKDGPKPAATQREVSVSGFWMGKYEVTQRDWQRLMTSRPWDGKRNVPADPDAPATYVDWNDANEFCKRLTESEHKVHRLPTNWKYALPSEAQWEYACRANTKSPFSFGVQLNNLDAFGWFKDNAMAVGQGYPHAVGKKGKNNWGLYDMHGNVAEWCSDLFVVPGVSTPPAGGESQRIVRGGSWNSSANDCRSSIRKRGPAKQEGSEVGFRVALIPVITGTSP